MNRLKQVLRIVGLVHVGLGPVLIAAVFFSSPWVIGEGRVQHALARFEDTDWRWWAMGLLLLVWGLPVLAVGAWLRARATGFESDRIRSRIEGLLVNRQVPISVDVDARVPVQVEEALRIPIELDTKLAIDEFIEIETMVPIHVTLPLDTDIETSVFGIGALKIPIRATIPLNLVLPIKGKIRIKSDALPVKLKDECIVRLPVFEVPIRSRFETRLDLLDNLRTAGKELRSGVREVLDGTKKD
jgi:hypothetical protein